MVLPLLLSPAPFRSLAQLDAWQSDADSSLMPLRSDKNDFHCRLDLELTCSLFLATYYPYRTADWIRSSYLTFNTVCSFRIASTSEFRAILNSAVRGTVPLSMVVLPGGNPGRTIVHVT